MQVKTTVRYLYTPSNANAKSLQSCPTLCDPIDGSPPGSAVPGTLQARTLEWVAISFSSAWKRKVKVKLLSDSQWPHGLKRNEVLMYVTPSMNLENIMFSETGQSQEDSVHFLSCMIPFIGKSTKTDNKWVVALDWEGWEISRERGWQGSDSSWVQDILREGWWKSSKTDCDEYSKPHWITYFKWLNCIACKFLKG